MFGHRDRSSPSRWPWRRSTPLASRRRDVRRPAIERLDERRVLAPTALITEFMAVGNTTLQSPAFGDFPDWIEIHNPGPETVDLLDWYLTDDKDELHGWQFPSSLVLAIGDFVVVFASGRDLTAAEQPAGEWHANFRLSAGGEYLALVHPDGTTIANEYEPVYPPQSSGVSYGLAASLDEEAYFAVPTPGSVNPPAFRDGAFNVSAGYFVSPIRVFIDTGALAAPIHYSLDGSLPTAAHPLYTGPIDIASTTVLRAVSLAPVSDGVVHTRTYLFTASTIAQPAAPAGFPTTWVDNAGGSTPADYAFDAEVATNPAYAGSLTDALVGLPSISVVVDPADLFSPAAGIYANPLASGDAWERPMSLELIDPNGGEGFQVGAGIRIDGVDDRNPAATPKHSFRITFRGSLGPSSLEASLFDDTPVDEFNRLRLDAMWADTWLSPEAQLRDRATLIRNQWLRNAHREMGHAGLNGRLVHLYLNGLYWGVYNLTEDFDDDFAEIHFGGDNSEYDLVDSGQVVDGQTAAWDALMALTAQPMSDMAWQQAQQFLDMTDFADFLVLRMYAGDEQITAGGRWFAYRNRVEGLPYRFLFGDAQRTLEAVDENAVTAADSPGDAAVMLYQWLRQHAQFRRLIGDRVQAHLFNGGALSAEHGTARLAELSTATADAIIAESARWGDYRRDVAPVGSGPFDLYTAEDHWLVETARLRDDFLPHRTDVFVQQLRDADLYPSTPAPAFSQHGGEIDEGTSIAITAAAGQIYFTTDGTGLTLSDGSPSPSAVLYTGPIVLSGDTDMRARLLSGGIWSALTQATFTTRPALRISEVLYHAHNDGPGDDDDFDFIEIANVGSTAVDLSGMSIGGGVSFAFDDGLIHSLEPGQRLVVVRDAAVFATRYDVSEVSIAGEYVGRLNNSGELVRLQGSLGQTIAEVQYSDQWHSITDNEGFSLVPRDESVVQVGVSSAAFWRPSQFRGGSPSAPDGGFNPDDIVISEALTHSDGIQGDWFELHNTTDRDVDVGGWYLSEAGSDLRTYTVAEGTTLPAYGYIVFTQGEPEIAQRYGGATEFHLSKLGDTVFVTSAGRDSELGGYRIEQTFTYGFNSSSFIRHTDSTGLTDYVPAVVRTPGTANAPPAVDRIWDHGSLYLEPVISEIMYQPPAGGDEYIEIYNPHDTALRLDNPFAPSWRFTEGITFNFPDAVVLLPYERLLVVPIDPAAFRAKYNVPGQVQIFGPYAGDLLNSGELLRVSRAAESDAFVPFSMTDQVHYNHPSGNWPASARGGGAALNRISYIAYGNEVLNWTAGVPTPGRPNVDETPIARVVGRRVFYNNSSFDAFDPSANLKDLDAIAWEKQPLLAGQRATFANYTNYVHGINGLLIDARGFANPSALSAADFEFRVGNSDDPSTWATAPTPASISFRPRASSSNPDQITIIWPDGAIVDTWLQVTVRATANTGLPTNDVFYFGNAIGETGNSSLQATVDFADSFGPNRNLNSEALVDHPYDFDRSGTIDDADVAISQSHANGLTGDLNGDGRVGLADVIQWQRHVGGMIADAYEGDLNGDFNVDLADLAAIVAQFGATSGVFGTRLRLISPAATTASGPAMASAVVVATATNEHRMTNDDAPLVAARRRMPGMTARHKSRHAALDSDALDHAAVDAALSAIARRGWRS
ncbi:MAG: lamin tail domain-containing protein [Pirellulales bacterium]